MNAKWKEFSQKSLSFLKKRKYYLATSLCILTIGVIYTAVAMVQGRGRLAAVKK